MTPTARFRDLDALRALAVLTVMLYHYTTRFDELYAHLPGLLFRVGDGSVLLVFMITGFAITMTLARKANCADFVLARAGRLFPAYWVAVLFTHEAVFRFGLPGREVGIGATMANMTMVQHFLGIADVDGAYWTLAVQLSFYLVISVLLIAGQFKHKVRFSAAWLGLLYAVAIGDRFVHPAPAVLKTLVMLDFGNLFIAGVMFYCLRAEPKTRYGSAVILAACLAFEYWFRDSRAFTLSLVFYGAFLLLIAGRLQWLASKPLDFVASISYPLYLLHQQIGYIVIREAYHLGVRSPNVAVILAMVVSLVLATLLSRLVERPAIQAVGHVREAIRTMPPLTLDPLGTTSPVTR